MITAADGSEFNVRLCGDGLADHPDGSFGTHNSFLCRALLSQSAAYLKSIYAFLPSPRAQLQAVWDRWAQPLVGGTGVPMVKREPFPVLER